MKLIGKTAIGSETVYLYEEDVGGGYFKLHYGDTVDRSTLYIHSSEDGKRLLYEHLTNGGPCWMLEITPDRWLPSEAHIYVGKANTHEGQGNPVHEPPGESGDIRILDDPEGIAAKIVSFGGGGKGIAWTSSSGRCCSAPISGTTIPLNAIKEAAGYLESNQQDVCDAASSAFTVDALRSKPHQVKFKSISDKEWWSATAESRGIKLNLAEPWGTGAKSLIKAVTASYTQEIPPVETPTCCGAKMAWNCYDKRWDCTKCRSSQSA